MINKKCISKCFGLLMKIKCHGKHLFQKMLQIYIFNFNSTTFSSKKHTLLNKTKGNSNTPLCHSLLIRKHQVQHSQDPSMPPLPWRPLCIIPAGSAACRQPPVRPPHGPGSRQPSSKQKVLLPPARCPSPRYR